MIAKRIVGKRQIAKEVGDRMLNITEKLSEAELSKTKDSLYEDSKNGIFRNGLLELICEKENLIDAIRKVKANGGFKTAGVDLETGQDFLNKSEKVIFERLRNALENYQPDNVKRVEIPKSNGKTRPLGIPTITDRIIQTAISNIIEPILEAQMYEHSYGFRPMRSIEHVYGYVSALTTHNQRHFVVEGDIKGYFDNINHKILINKLWKYGIRDKRVIMLIKKILKAGIQGIKEVNDIGTPQGGTISTLLSNVYLNDFDHWVDKQWRRFDTRYDYVQNAHRTRALTKSTTLKDGILIRYADDWIIMTNSYENAVKWKHACQKYLKNELKIELSEEKTLITDLRTSKASFLGYKMFKVKGKNEHFTLRTQPDFDRLTDKRKKLTEELRNMRKANSQTELYGAIVKYNSIIRGLRNFYRYSTLTAMIPQKLFLETKSSLYKTISKCGFKKGKLKDMVNLKHLEREFGERTVYYKVISGAKIAIEPITSFKHIKPKVKAQWIHPYSVEGREKYEETSKKSYTTKFRNMELTNLNRLNLIAKDSTSLYTLEYFINRPMAFNRDRCECRECKRPLTGYGDVNIHHLDPNLEKEKVNKLPNLVTLCVECHIEEHRMQREKKRKKRKPSATNQSKSMPKVRKSKKPTKEILMEEIKTSSLTKLGEKYGVSANAVKKWCKSYDIFHLSKTRHKNK